MIVTDYQRFIEDGDKRAKIMRDAKAAHTSQPTFKAVSSSYGSNAAYPVVRYGGQQYPYGIDASGASILIDHKELRANGRTAFHDSSIGRSLVKRKSDIVVESGMVLKPTPIAELLGITKKAAEKWSRGFATRFHLWAKSNKATLKENQNFYQAQHLMVLSLSRDGEYFIRLHYKDDPTLTNPLQIEFVDPDQITGDVYTSTDGAAYYADDGIEKDKDGKEVAYFVEVFDKKLGHHVTRRITKYSKSGRLQMVHGYNVFYAGQTRGFSDLGHLIQKLQDITTLDVSTIVKAINQASIVLSVEPSDDAPATNPGFVVNDNRYSGPHESPEPASLPAQADIHDGFKAVEYPEATFSRPGSTLVLGMQSGEKLVPFKDTTDHEHYGPFVDALVSYLAAGSDMPIEMLIMRFGSNYSASRGVFELAYRVAKIIRQDLESDALNPIAEAFAAGEIAAGRMRARGWLDPLFRAAWLNNQWIGATMPQIDPNKEADAKRKNLEMGLSDLVTEAHNHNGSDAIRNMEALTDQYSKLPIAPWSQAAQSTNENSEGD